jgi:hypothetical protein
LLGDTLDEVFIACKAKSIFSNEIFPGKSKVSDTIRLQNEMRRLSFLQLKWKVLKNFLFRAVFPFNEIMKSKSYTRKKDEAQSFSSRFSLSFQLPSRCKV